jgi:hypothetical protein
MVHGIVFYYAFFFLIFSFSFFLILFFLFLFLFFLEIGGPRNWDYRYTWVRDSAFTVYALMRLGMTQETENYMRFMEKRCQDLVSIYLYSINLSILHYLDLM